MKNLTITELATITNQPVATMFKTISANPKNVLSTTDYLSDHYINLLTLGWNEATYANMNARLSTIRTNIK